MEAVQCVLLFLRELAPGLLSALGPILLVLLLCLPAFADAEDPLDSDHYPFAIKLDSGKPVAPAKGGIEVRAGNYPACITEIANHVGDTAHITVHTSGILTWTDPAMANPIVISSVNVNGSVWRAWPGQPDPTLSFYEGWVTDVSSTNAYGRWPRLRKVNNPGATVALPYPWCFHPGSSFYAMGSSAADRVVLTLIGFELR